MESGSADKRKRLKRRSSQPLVAGAHKAPQRVPVLVVVSSATVTEPLKVTVFAPVRYRVEIYVEGDMSHAQGRRWIEAWCAYQARKAARYSKESECAGCREWKATAERWLKIYGEIDGDELRQ